MSEYILALIPQYGLYIVFFVVMIACLGIPLPSSVVVLTSGSLAAAGDLVIWQVVLAALAGFALGDQIAFNAARLMGPNLLDKARDSKRISPIVNRSEAMLDKHGLLAVLLSRTIFSPTGPFVGFISGAVNMNWFLFTSVAVFSAFLWASAYALLGYLFAGELPQISDLVASMLVTGVATLFAISFGVWSYRAWRNFEAEQK